MQKERKDKFIIIRVSASLKNKFIALSKKEDGGNLSDYVRSILDKFLHEKN
jgi:hypothetical protein